MRSTRTNKAQTCICRDYIATYNRNRIFTFANVGITATVLDNPLGKHLLARQSCSLLPHAAPCLSGICSAISTRTKTRNPEQKKLNTTNTGGHNTSRSSTSSTHLSSSQLISLRFTLILSLHLHICLALVVQVFTFSFRICFHNTTTLIVIRTEYFCGFLQTIQAKIQT
jgi:hypothetical protein